MGEMIKLKGPDGFEFDAYHAVPTGSRKGGIIIIQEIFGLDEHVLRDVDRWAGLGYEAVAPSMYDRAERGFTAAHDQAGMQAGVAHMRATPADQAMGDIEAVRAYLAPRGKVVITGYCYGGSMTWLAAAKVEGLAAAACYYGSMILANASLTPKCPTIVHLGREDKSIPCDEVKAAVEAANPSVSVYIYDGAGHGFNNEDPARWSEAASALARQRTLELFDKA